MNGENRTDGVSGYTCTTLPGITFRNFSSNQA